MKAKRLKRQWKGPLPTSGEIIGGLANLLEWKPEQAVQERTWRKFRRGVHVSQESRDAILEELAGSILSSVGELRTPTGELVPREFAVAQWQWLFKTYASWWDELCKELQEAIPTKPTEFINASVYRLVTVELVVRISAVCALWNLEAVAPPPEKLDVEEFLLPLILRKMLGRLGITREELAAKSGVSREEVYRRLSPDAVIGVKALDDIAEVIAEKTGMEWSQLSFSLRWSRLETRMLKAIRNRVGKNELNDLVAALFRMTQAPLVALHSQVGQLEEPARTMALIDVLVLGSESVLGPCLRAAMLEQEKDDLWRGAIQTVPTQWKSCLARTLAVAQRHTEIRELSAREHFKYLSTEGEQVHLAGLALVLIPPEGLPAPWAELLRTPGELSDEVLLELATSYYFYLGSEEADPETWWRLMELAERCRLVLIERPGARRTGWLALSWLSYARGLAKLLATYPRIEEGGGRPHESLKWMDRMGEALQALPPVPDEVEPELQPLMDFVRNLKAELSEIPERAGRIRELMLHLPPDA
ncbi:helix-turn-helix domain-containing protein [Pyxidicoccus sp. 3LG]